MLTIALHAIIPYLKYLLHQIFVFVVLEHTKTAQIVQFVMFFVKPVLQVLRIVFHAIFPMEAFLMEIYVNVLPINSEILHFSVMDAILPVILALDFLKQIVYHAVLLKIVDYLEQLAFVI